MISYRALTLALLAGCSTALLGDQLSAQSADNAQTTLLAAQPRPDASWQAEHQRLNRLPSKASANIVFLGGSCVAHWEANATNVWNEFYRDRGPVNLAVADDACQNLLWRIENGNLDSCQPKLVVLQIGEQELASGDHNPQQIADRVAVLVDKVRAKLPGSKLLMLGLLPLGDSPESAERQKVAEVNRLVSKLADWQDTHFLDVGHALLAEDSSLAAAVVNETGDLTDEGYRRWAAAIDFKVAELLGETDDQHKKLFDGESLTGWKAGDEDGPPEGWKVVDGTLSIVERGTDAQTVDLYKNFDFQCEWKVERRSNTGIFYRWADYAGIVSAGPEYQVIDDVGRKLPADLNSSTAATADMYGPPTDKPVREPGEWNHTRIVVVDGEVEHWLNGIRVLSFDMASEDWRKRLADSKFRRLWPFGRIYEGAFRLQNYGGMPAAFRDITVAEL